MYHLAMQTWQKNLGTSLSALGLTLMGTGIIPQLGLNPSTHTTLLNILAIAGFVLKAAGSFINDLFGVDVKTVETSIQENNLVMHGANSPALPPIDKTTPVPTAVSKAPTI